MKRKLSKKEIKKRLDIGAKLFVKNYYDVMKKLSKE